MKNNLIKKFISLFTIFAILICSMPNLGILNNVVNAANLEQAKMVIKSEMTDFEVIGENKVFKLNVCLQNVSTNSWSIYMKYNSDKFTPADKTTGEATTNIDKCINITNGAQFGRDTNGNGYADNGEICFTANTGSATPPSLAYLPFTEAQEICTIFFRVNTDKSPGLTISQVVNDDFVINLNKDDTDFTSIALSDEEADLSSSGDGIIYADIDGDYFQCEEFNFAPPVEEKKVQSLAISGTLAEYIVGDKLDLNNVKVIKTYNDTPSTTEEVTLNSILSDTNYEVKIVNGANETVLTADSTLSIGDSLKVSYVGTDKVDGEVSTTQALNVREEKITKIEFQGFNASYKQGDIIDLSTISVIATYEKSGDKILASDKYTLSATGNSIVGNKITLTNAGDTTITATLKEDTSKTTTKTITIAEKQLIGIEVTGPTKDVYTVGETLDLTGLTVTAKYNNNGTETTETITSGYTTSISEGTALSTAGVQTITVDYNGQPATFNIVVFPTKLVGTEGQQLSTIVVGEDFGWESVGDTTIAVGVQNRTLTFTNTADSTKKTCEVEVLGIPSNLTATYGDTLADVKYNNGALPTGFAWSDTTTSVGDAGEQTHSITYDGYTGLNAKVTVAKKTLTKADLTYTMLSGKKYDGQPISDLNVTAPAGTGTVTVKYYKNGQTSGTTTAPTNVGTYKAKVSVLEGANYTALAETELDESFEITKGTLKAEDFDKTIPTDKEYDGSALTASASIKAGIVGAGTTVTVKYYKNGQTSGSTSAPTDYGTYTVKVNVNEGENYFAADGTDGKEEIEIGSFSITKKQLAISDIEISPKTFTYNGVKQIPTVQPKADVTGAGTITATYWQGSTQITNPTDAGTYTVKITSTGATNYEDITIPMEVGTYEIEKADIDSSKITVTPDAEKTYDGNPSSATATLDTTVPGATDVTIDVTYVDAEGNIVTNPTDAGTYTIKVSSNGGANYNPLTATDRTETIVINKVTLSETDIQCTLLGNLVYDNTSKKATVTVAKDLGNGKTLTVNADDITVTYKDATGTEVADPKNAGTYTIDVSVSAGKNYEALTVAGVETYTVEKADVVVGDFEITGIPTGGSKEYDGNEVSVTATQKSHITETLATQVEYYASTDTEHALTSTPSGVGEYIVKLKVTEGTNYKSANLDLGSFTITPKGFDKNKVKYTNTAEYDGTNKDNNTVNIYIEGDTLATITDVKFYQAGNEVNAKNVGTYTVKADVTTTESGHVGVVEIGTFTITEKPITVEIQDETIVYGQELTTIRTNDDVEICTGDNIDDIITYELSATTVGEQTIIGKVKDTETAKNYNVTFTNGKCTITKKPVTVQIRNTSSVYTGTEPTLPATSALVTIPDGAIVGTDDLGITLSKASGVDAGDYAITGAYTNTNYDITFVNKEDNTKATGTYTITKATLTSEDFNNDLPTEDVAFGTTVTINPTYKAGITETDAGAITVKYYKKDDNTEIPNPTAVGTYVVKVSTHGGTNYYPADGSTDAEGNTYEEITLGEFSIVRSTELPTITITAPTDNTYDKTKKEPTINKPDGIGNATITYYKKEDNGTETLVTDPIDAGTYIVKVATDGGENYGPMTETKVGEFTIFPRPVEVTIEDKTSVYGDAIDTLTSRVTEGNVITGDDLGITLSKADGTDAKEYAITGEATNTNYDVTFVDGEYTITTRPITISIDNKESAIKDNLAELTYQVTVGTEVVAKEAVKLQTNANKEAVGTYDITVKSENSNYNVTIANTDEKAVYTVKDKVKEIKLSKDTIEADCGTSLENLINGITYTVVYEGDGAQTPQALTTDMITTTYNPDTTETQTLTVRYTDNDTFSATNGQPFTADLTVTLKDTLLSIDVIGVTTEYYEGQTFKKEGMTVTANYAKTTSHPVDNYEIYIVNADGTETKIEDTTKLSKDNNKIKVKYTENGKTVSSNEIAITVKEDEIDAITFNFNGEATYNYGDSIDLGTSTVTRTWKSGLVHADDTIPMTIDMLSNVDITNFNKMNVLGTKDITVTAFGKTSANTFQITVNDVVTGIAIVDKDNLQKEYDINSSLNYNYKDTTNPVKVTVTYAGSGAKEIDLADCTLSGYDLTDETKIGDLQTVKVTYEGKTDSFNVKLRDYVKRIRVTKYKGIYDIGDNLDIQEVKAIMASNVEKVITGYTTSGFNSTTPGTVTVTVNYEGKEASINVTIRNKVADMYIEKLPSQISSDGTTVDKTIPFGTDLTKTNGIIVVKDAENPAGIEIPMTDPAVSIEGYNKNIVGEQTVTVRYTYKEISDEGEEVTKSKTATFNVTVEDYETGYKVTPPTKTTYDYGMPLDLTGATVSKVWASGKTTTPTEISGGMISEYSATTLGAQTITVNAFGKENVGSFIITVVDRTLGISMKELPNKTEYTQGESLDVTGAVLNVTKSSGIKEIPVTKEMISGYNPEKIGTQVITVTYDGKQTEFTVNVKEAPKKPTTPSKPTTPTKPVKPTKPSTPNNNKPVISEVEKYTVTFINYDGNIIKTEEVEAGKSATAPEVGDRVGYKFLGWDKNFDVVEENITVMAKYEKVIRAEINAPDNMVIEQGKDLDLSDVTMIIYDENGEKIDEIPVTLDMISNFNSNKVGIQTITVTYVDEEGFEYTDTFKVRVKKPVQTLGVKEEVKEEENTNNLILPIGIGAGATGLLLFLLAWATKKNVKIYAVTDEKRKLVVKQKITNKNRRIELEEYEKYFEDANIEIVLNKKITEKLDEKMVDVIFKGKKATYKVKDRGNEEFIIKIKNV